MLNRAGGVAQVVTERRVCANAYFPWLADLLLMCRFNAGKVLTQYMQPRTWRALYGKIPLR